MSDFRDRMTGGQMDLARRVFAAGLFGELKAAQRAVYAGGYEAIAVWEAKIVAVEAARREPGQAPTSKGEA